MSGRGLGVIGIVLIVAVAIVVIGLLSISIGFSPAGFKASLATECADNRDNDRDGLKNADDPGCWNNPEDSVSYNPDLDYEARATSQCQDRLDNDRDGLIDFPDDSDCESSQDYTEGRSSLGLGDINGDGFIDFRDLSIIQDEWGLSGVSDLNEDGVVDYADLEILIYEWDEKMGEGVCDEYSIPNNIGGCSNILCRPSGADGGGDDSSDAGTQVQVNSLGGSFSVQVFGSGIYVTESNPHRREFYIEDAGLGTERVLSFDEMTDNNNFRGEIVRVDMASSPKKRIVSLDTGGSGEVPLSIVEPINITYNKTSDLGGGVGSKITANVVCYNVGEGGRPVFPSGSALFGQKIWYQDPGEVITMQIIPYGAHSELEKCQIRLHETEIDIYTDMKATKVSLVSDLADEVYFSDENLSESLVFEALKDEFPEGQLVSGFSMEDDSSSGAFFLSCRGFDVSDLFVYTNGHPDYEDIASYGITSRKVEEIVLPVAHKERYLAQGWTGLPLENRRVDEKESLIYNPALQGGFRDSTLGYFAKSIVLSGVDLDGANEYSFFFEPFTRKLKVFTFDDLGYGEDYGISTLVKESFVNEYNSISVDLGGSLNIPEEVNFLEFFEEPLIENSTIDEDNRFFYGTLYDVSTGTFFYATHVYYQGAPRLDFGYLRITSPLYQRFEGTGMLVFSCYIPQLSNPLFGNCDEGIYDLKYDYRGEIEGEIFGEACLRYEGGAEITPVDCPD